MKLSAKPYTLQLNHTFSISGHSRNTTPIVLTQIEQDGIAGYGEASMPPYLGESHESVLKFLSMVDFKNHRLNSVEDIDSMMKKVDAIAPGNAAAKASIDIALFDLLGKIKKQPVFKLLGIDDKKMPLTSFTIGIAGPEEIKKKVREATAFQILKVKLGATNDKEIIESIRTETDKVICVDANQGWRSKEFALEMITWLQQKNVSFVEQPLSKGNLEDAQWLKERSPLPVIADEAFQRISDVEKIKDAYHGVNIKLMKCSGINEALKMIESAKKHRLKVLVGCMNESSCATLAAAQIAPLADFVDLDGPFMISNNPFAAPELKEGKIVLKDLPGIGLKTIRE